MGSHIGGHEQHPHNLWRYGEDAVDRGLALEQSCGLVGVTHLGGDHRKLPGDRVEEDLDPVLQHVEQEIGAIGQQLAGIGGTGVEGDAEDDRESGEQHQSESQCQCHGQRQAGPGHANGHGDTTQQPGRAIPGSDAAPRPGCGAEKSHLTR